MRLDPKFELDCVAGQHMLVDSASDCVFGINEPAAWLWERIGQQDFDEPLLVEWLCAEYDVDPLRAKADVHNIVLLWQKYGMLL